MHVQVQRDQEAYGYRDNWIWKAGSNDINFCIVSKNLFRERQIHSQKHIVPVDMRTTARATKKGPAAPVTLFPHRSRVLKQPNTHFAQIMAAKKTLSSQNALKGRAVVLTPWLNNVIDAY